MRLDTNNHSVFKLHYHLMMTIKYRREAIDEPISIRLKTIFEDIGKNYHITVQGWEHNIDHVYVRMSAKPNTELSKFINAYKSASSRRIKKEFPEIRQKLWEEHFWSQSYCLLTIGDAPSEVFEEYLNKQKQH